MWETKVTAGCVAMCLLGFAGFVLIGLGAWLGVPAIGQGGMLVGCSSLALAVIRDNQRTRRMLGRPGEHVGPMRSVRE